MYRKIVNKIKKWYHGEHVVVPVPKGTIGIPIAYNIQPLLAKILGAIGTFWLRRWPILLPIIVVSLVTLFIHFDNKSTTGSRQSQNSGITTNQHAK